MKIAVIGSEGMLGRDLAGFLSERHDVAGLDIGQIDIRLREDTIAAIAELKPQLIINSAACVDVESCEAEPERAFQVNAVAADGLLNIGTQLHALDNVLECSPAFCQAAAR